MLNEEQDVNYAQQFSLKLKPTTINRAVFNTDQQKSEQFYMIERLVNNNNNNCFATFHKSRLHYS